MLIEKIFKIYIYYLLRARINFLSAQLNQNHKKYQEISTIYNFIQEE